MYLREFHRKRESKDYTYWGLCETIRTERGPRQRLVSYLGDINSGQQHCWRKSIQILQEGNQPQELRLFPESSSAIADEPGIVKVRFHGIRWERPRDFGDVYAGWVLWQRLGLDQFYRQRLDERECDADVPWSLVAAILAINRLCEPRSELSIEEKWYRRTALDDILGVSIDKINDTRLYRCLDLLIKNKEQLEKHLKAKWGELFKATFDVLLYDLTSTYFEGEAKGNPQAKRGYSRDHRPDCKQVLVALIVSEEGFPFAFEVLDGNRRDVTTLEEILNAIDNKYGYARRIWVFDRGVVSEENLKILRKRKSPYVVGVRRSELKSFEKELASKNWQTIKKDVEVHLVPRHGGNETWVLVRSQGRKAKEQAMREGAMKAIEQALTKLAAGITKGRIKDELKIQRKIGAILARRSSAAKLYKVTLEKNPTGRFALLWKHNEQHLSWAKMTEGSYLVRTNMGEVEPAKLWEMYIQLTEAEAAFRAIKSELLVRPIWHHKQKRVQAHILVAFLGYALWVTLKHSLRNSSSLQPKKDYDWDISPAKALDALSLVKSGDIILPTADDRTLRLRRVGTPEREARELLEKLKIDLPERLGKDEYL